MHSINSVGEIAAIERRGGVAFVLLMSPLETTALQWLIRAWMNIHMESGCRWHLVVPTHRPSAPNDPMTMISDYNGALAEDLLRLYGLSAPDMPCLVIDNFDDGQRQRFIPLPADDHSRDRLLIDISDHLRRSWPDGGAGGGERTRLGEQLRRTLLGKRHRRQITRALPMVGSVLAKRLATGGA